MFYQIVDYTVMMKLVRVIYNRIINKKRKQLRLYAPKEEKKKDVSKYSRWCGEKRKSKGGKNSCKNILQMKKIKSSVFVLIL